MKNEGKNGNRCELGDDGIILRNCIPDRMVHIWFIGCCDIGYHCNGRDGHYPVQVKKELTSVWLHNPNMIMYGSPPVTRSKVRKWKHVPYQTCLLYTSPSPRDGLLSRMP